MINTLYAMINTLNEAEEKAAEIYVQADTIAEFLKPLVIGGVAGLVVFAVYTYFIIKAWVG